MTTTTNCHVFTNVSNGITILICPPGSDIESQDSVLFMLDYSDAACLRDELTKLIPEIKPIENGTI